MKKLTDTLKQMLNALAHADAGEYLNRQQKDQILDGVPALTEKTEAIKAARPSNSKRRRVALYLGSELPAEVMTYIVDTCENLQHDLTVLTSQTESTARALLQPHNEALNTAGVDVQLVQLSGDPISGLSRYLKGRPEIAFLACKDSGYLGRKIRQNSQGKNLMPVPVVVVDTGKADSSSQQPAENNDSINVA